MLIPKSVCVYCGSANNVNRGYTEGARRLGGLRAHDHAGALQAIQVGVVHLEAVPVALALACFIAYLASGRGGIYSAQRPASATP